MLNDTLYMIPFHIIQLQEVHIRSDIIIPCLWCIH